MVDENPTKGKAEPTVRPRRTPYELITSHLDGTDSGSSFSARCPAHDDHHPSLSVFKNADGSAGVKCHTGCSTDAILAAIGLQKRDLFPPGAAGAGKDKAPRVKSPGKAGNAVCNGVYRALLAALGDPEPRHRDALQRRGLNDRQIDLRGYASLGRSTDRHKIANKLFGRFADKLLSVPGFVKEDGDVTLKGAAGLVIPVRDVKGRAIALSIRRDDDDGGGKYVWLSSKKHRGFGPGAPIHIPLFEGDKTTVRVTEGALKADIATARTGMLSLGLPGASAHKDVVRVLKLLGAKTVRLALDADAKRNKNVAQGLKKLAGDLRQGGLAVELETWDEADGKGIDDVLTAGKTPVVLVGDEAAAMIRDIAVVAGVRTDERPTIFISTEEHEVNELAVAALTRATDLFQRAGLLVRVVCDDSYKKKGIRRPFAPRIEPLPQAVLRELLAANAQWKTLRGTGDKMSVEPAHPPGWCVAALHAHASWPGIPYLEAVIDYPVLRPDGTILSRPGYDVDTGLLLVPTITCNVPDAPTRADAVAARDTLLKIVADFPFEQQVHKGNWLAGLLTPLARFAYAGPSPLFLVDSNVRAAGKGLLCHCTSLIITGEQFTVATYTDNEEELRKRITSLALTGERLVLFDNLNGPFGNAVLDAALTATAWKDRILGVSRMMEAPLYIVWFATGNNVAIEADTARRTCHIRLESDQERPEERQDFRHPHLLSYVARKRAKLLSAALMILRAYCVAGRPDMGLPAWGSFEGWSSLVRNAVVWVGMPDPAAARMPLQDRVDDIAEGMNALLDCWEKMDPDRQGLTTAQVINRLNRPANPNDDSVEDWELELPLAIGALIGKPDATKLSYKLRSYARRIFRGRYIDRTGTKNHQVVRWAVYPASAFAGGEKRPPHPPLRRGEDGEDGEDVSPQPKSEHKSTREPIHGLHSSEKRVGAKHPPRPPHPPRHGRRKEGKP